MAALTIEGWVLAILSVVLTWLPVFLPVEGLFLTIVAPFPLIVCAVKYPWRYALSVAALEAVGLLLFGGIDVLVFFAQYGLVPLVMAWAIHQRYSMARTVLWSVGIPLGAGGVLLVMYGVMVQQSPYLLLTQHLEHMLAALQEHFQDVMQAGEIDSEQLQVLTEVIPQLLRSIFPALVVINYLLTNVANYALVRYYCARSRPPIVLPPADLACWRASDYLVWVFLGSGAALLVPIPALSMIGLNVFLVTLTLYLLQGLAIVIFWGRHLPFPLGVRVVLGMMLFLLAGPLCVGLCITAGLFDLWIDFRRQRGQPLVS
jgi:hypothetical protein